MRTMYDGISASNLPAGGDLYAGYVDGNWPDAGTVARLFPGKRIVRIATSADTDDGVVGDGPPDNGSWAAWVQWTVRRRAAGVDPTVYTNSSSWSAGIQAFTSAGVAQPHWWIAHYDGDPTIPSGAVAKQYASNDSYDTSSVADYWPGVDPAPTRAAVAAIIEEDSVQIEPLSVHPGDYALIVPPGVKAFAIAADGEDAPGASLRIVLWNADTPTVLTLAVGGTAAHHFLGHPLAGANALTVSRLDSQSYPVAIGFQS